MLNLDLERALYGACQIADYEILGYCLNNGVNIENVESQYGSLIEVAIISGDGEFVDCLIRNGATLQPHHLHSAAAVANQNVILCVHRHFLERNWSTQIEYSGITPLQILEDRIAYPGEGDNPLILSVARFGLTYDFKEDP